MHIALWCEGSGGKRALFQPLLTSWWQGRVRRPVTWATGNTCFWVWEPWEQGPGHRAPLSHCPEQWGMGLNPHTIREGLDLGFLLEWVLQLAPAPAGDSELHPNRQAYGDIQPCNAPLHQWTGPPPSGPSWKTEARAFPCCTGMLQGQRPLQTDCNVFR